MNSGTWLPAEVTSNQWFPAAASVGCFSAGSNDWGEATGHVVGKGSGTYSASLKTALHREESSNHPGADLNALPNSDVRENPFVITQAQNLTPLCM